MFIIILVVSIISCIHCKAKIIDGIDYKNETVPVILGFMLFSEKEIFKPDWTEIEDSLGYTGAVINVLMNTTDTALYQINFNRTVFNDYGKVDIMSFDLTNKQKKKLMQAGYDSIKQYFEE